MLNPFSKIDNYYLFDYFIVRSIDISLIPILLLSNSYNHLMKQSQSQKKKIMLSASARYALQHFIKSYKHSVQKLSLGESMTMKQVLKMLDFMGFVNEFLTDQDQELTHTITDMLSYPKHSGYVSHSNLCNFLMIVSNIEGNHIDYFAEDVHALPMDYSQKFTKPMIEVTIGHFNQNGKWFCDQEEKNKIKEMFNFMNLKRISRPQIDCLKKQSKALKGVYEHSFKPKILTNAQVLGQKRMERLRINSQQKVQDRLLISQSMFLIKMSKEKQRFQEKSLQNCSFKPHINQIKIKPNKQNYITEIGSQNKQRYMHSLSKNESLKVQDRLIYKGKFYQTKQRSLEKQKQSRKYIEDLKKCSFKPILNETLCSTLSNSKVTVKNQDKSISRLKNARENRQKMNKTLKRGYPKDVSWMKFMNNLHGSSSLALKNSRDSSFERVESQNPISMPILSIDLKILNDKFNINVFEGQNIKQLSEFISVQNRIPEESWGKVEELIVSSLERCGDIYIKNHRVFSNNI